MPTELSQRMADGSVILFVGSGMSQPQLPGWTPLLEMMIEWTRAHSIFLDLMEDFIWDLIKNEDLLLAAQELRLRMGESNFHRFMQTVFRNPNLKPGRAHQIIPEVGFPAVLTGVSILRPRSNGL
jgi:hypothetical protein